MSTRVAVSALAGALVVGGVVAACLGVGTADAADAPARPAIREVSATPLVLGATGTRTFRFSATVSDGSGISSVKVLAWPKSSNVTPRKRDLVLTTEKATCKASSPTTSVCTYSTPVGPQDADDTPTGRWYVAVLVTAKDHDTTFDAKASAFTVTRRAR